ncbi:unnamed protein product, partial [Iphiclides podalirius]
MQHEQLLRGSTSSYHMFPSGNGPVTFPAEATTVAVKMWSAGHNVKSRQGRLVRSSDSCWELMFRAGD